MSPASDTLIPSSSPPVAPPLGSPAAAGRDSDPARLLAAAEREAEIPLAALAAIAELVDFLWQSDQALAAGSGGRRE